MNWRTCVAAALLWSMLGGCATEQPQALVEMPATRPMVTMVRSSPDIPIQQMIPTESRQPTTLPSPRIIRDGARSTLIYTARSAHPRVLSDAVEDLVSPEGTVQDSPALNVVIVNDKSEFMNAMLEVLTELDRPVPQLLVEARIIEVTLNNDFEYELRHFWNVVDHPSLFLQDSEVNLNTPGANDNPDEGSLLNIRSWIDDNARLDTFIRLLVSRGQAKLLSSPNLIVGAGSDSSIITGEEVPVQSSTFAGGSIQTTTTFKRVGIKLRVDLQQITNNTARVEINPEVSAVTSFTESTDNIPAQPIVAIRNVTSTLSIKDGEILTVGGLLRAEERKDTRGIPILQDIPVVGNLFKSVREQTIKTQLIFFLRCHILESGEVNVGRVHTPGDSLELLDRLIGGPATQPADLKRDDLVPP